jgi:hypothetical protein
MEHDRRVVPLFRRAPHAGTGPVSVGNVALAGQPAVHGKLRRHDEADTSGARWFPVDPESDTQPIPAIRLSMDWAADLGEPRDPAMAMDPGIGIESDLDDEAFGLRPASEPGPAVGPRQASGLRPAVEAAGPAAPADLARLRSLSAAGAPTQPPSPGPAAGEFADGRTLLRAGLLVILALAVAVALTLALAVAVSGHSGPAGTSTQAGSQISQDAPGECLQMAEQAADAVYCPSQVTGPQNR